MDAPVSVSPLPAAPRASVHPRKPILATITGVCFLFGALLAVQLRAIQNVEQSQKLRTENANFAQQQADKFREQARVEAAARAKSDAKLVALTAKLAGNSKLSVAQVAALNNQIKELQTIAGLTPISGPGLRITLSDDPQAASLGGDPSQMLPGIVHDYDLLQTVNELRLTKADAIAVRGAGGEAIRLTGYTPIRCVGSTILIDWQAVAAPFTIEVVGNSKTLNSALSMPGGIVDILRKNGAIGVEIKSVQNLELPAATGGAPKLKVAVSTKAG